MHSVSASPRRPVEAGDGSWYTFSITSSATRLVLVSRRRAARAWRRAIALSQPAKSASGIRKFSLRYAIWAVSWTTSSAAWKSPQIARLYANSIGRCGRRTRSNAFGSPPCAALRSRVSWSATAVSGLLLAVPHLARGVRRDAQRTGRALQEQDREARVDRAVAPRTGGGLGLDEDLRAFRIPLVGAHHLGAVQHARALEGIHVVEVLVLRVLSAVLGVLVGAGVVGDG